jgi:hypothetical protein
MVHLPRLLAVARWSCVHVDRLAIVVVRIVVIAIVGSNSRAAHCRKGPTPPTMQRNLMESMRDSNCASPLPLFIKVPIQLPGEWS